MTFYFLILFTAYFFLLLILNLGWRRAMRVATPAPLADRIFLSVVVPIRNEKKNLVALVNSLSSQTLPNEDYELIFVDDHSTDKSLDRLHEFSRRFQNVEVISLTQSAGKKAAITAGVAASHGEIIVTTDADCSHPQQWLRSIQECFRNESTNMVAGLVTVDGGHKFFSRWQAMEFASVIGTGVAAFGLGAPFMCNGANIAFRKNVFEDVGGYSGNDHIASGDDEFLMRKIATKFPSSVSLMNSAFACVTTQPQSSLKNFLSQRIRWASKWKSNPSVGVKLLAAFVWVVQISWLLLLFGVTNDRKLVFAAVLKILADLIFLLPVFRTLRVRFNFLAFAALQFLYPCYVILVGTLSPWMAYSWKDRKIS